MFTNLKDPIKLAHQDLPTTRDLMKVKDLVLEDNTSSTGQEKAVKAAKNAEIEEVKRKTVAKSNNTALWGLIIGQCSNSVQQTIKAKMGMIKMFITWCGH